MSRNRVIYQSEALFVSKDVNSTGKKDHAQLRRVQSANYSFNVSRTDVNQFGQLSRIDSLILEAPTVSADISYLLTDGFNEEALGFSNSNLNVGFISGQIETDSGRNLYIVTSAESKDVNFSTGEDFGTIGIGNAFLTDYSLEASVGSFPTVTCSFEGSNMNASANVTGKQTGTQPTQLDAGFGNAGSDLNSADPPVEQNHGNLSGAGIDPVDGTPLSNQVAQLGVALRPALPATDSDAITALRPGDVTLNLTGANGDTIAVLTGSDSINVQSVSLSIPMSRTPIERLGTKFPFARTVDFPITPSLSVSAIVNETQARSLTTIVGSDGFINQADITIKQPGSTTNAAVYRFKNLKLDSESFSSSIGPNKTVDLTFSVSIGGPDDTDNNVFFSGSNTDKEFSLSPIQLSGKTMVGAKGIIVNGVELGSTDSGVFAFNHGEASQTFNIRYSGGDDLTFSLTGNTTFSGVGDNGTNAGFTGAPGTDLTMVVTPNTATDITDGDINAAALITGTFDITDA